MHQSLDSVLAGGEGDLAGGKTYPLTSLVLLDVEHAEQVHGGVSSMSAFGAESGLHVAAVTVVGVRLWKLRDSADSVLACVLQVSLTILLGAGEGVLMDGKDTARTSKLIVDSAKIDVLDAKLSEHAGAHDAWLNRDEKLTLAEKARAHYWGRMELLSVWVRSAREVRRICSRIDSVPIGLAIEGVYLVGVALERDNAFARVHHLGIDFADAEESLDSEELSVPGAIPRLISCIHALSNHAAVVHDNTTNRGFIGV